MSANAFKVVIVGAGPGGLSAGARSAETQTSHILLEASSGIAKTISNFQKGKHVMAEPAVLPTRAAVGFSAGTRESVLEGWESGISQHEVNIKFNANVTKIEKTAQGFELNLSDGSQITSDNVVLSIGMQGNVRKLGTEGEDLAFVQYQLDDPDEYIDETIVVVGAGDAAIENALALAGHNDVYILNRRDEFARAKEGNLTAIMGAIDKGTLNCIYNANAVKVTSLSEDSETHRLNFQIKTKEEEIDLKCDRIIGRLGALPPRKFLESVGIEFTSDDPTAVPIVSPKYESNIPGLYVIGALAGYPLIKQCLNQGYEVIETISGREVEPADEALLWDKFQNVAGINSVDEGIELVRSSIPLFESLSPLQLREFLLDSEIHSPKEGEKLIEYNDYTNTFFTVLQGKVNVKIKPSDPEPTLELGTGKFVGEMSLISGRRRSTSVYAGTKCVVIETPRRSMNKLINSNDSVKRAIDEAFMIRAIKMHLAPEVEEEHLAEIVKNATLEKFEADQELFNEGDQGDSLYLIRSGSVTVSKSIGEKNTTLAYLPAGNYVGEMALMTDMPRSATVKAAVSTETIVLKGKDFRNLLSKNPDTKHQLELLIAQRLQQNKEKKSGHGEGLVEFLMEQGLGEATDVLLIDESLCVRCDNCEKACADTHGGMSMLDREAGPTVAGVHVPTSCRHCEHPHCMKDCPPDAIHRTPEGEVYIADNCIGCGNCEQNCPYGVIQMAVKNTAEPRPLWKQILFGLDPYPTPSKNEGGAKTAAKCDMCKELPQGPACVRACPTGAAIRVSPEEFISLKMNN